jgi:hypothetical protein
MSTPRKRGPPDRYIDDQYRQIERDKEIRRAKAKEAVKKQSDQADRDTSVNTAGIIPTGAYKIMYLDFVSVPDLTKPATYPLLITQNDFSLINAMNTGTFGGFILPPGGTADFRGMFSDLNRILIAQQRLSYVSDDSELTLRVTTSANCNNNGPRAVRNPGQQWYNMCFYCGKQKGTKDLQCDHVIPIMQMFVSVEPTPNIFYNFESVHRVCNNKAKNMSLAEIWNKIGTKEFPGPNGYSDALINYQINGTPRAISTSSARQELCRGYLAYQILNKLTFYDTPSQLTRRDQLEKVAVKYKDFKSTVEDQYLSEVGSAASILMDLSSGKRSKMDTSFGNQPRTIKLVKISKLKNNDKKYEAVFLVDGKEKKQKFGASGMSDYTLHRNIERRNNYINRHIVDLRTGNPTRAGFLSMYVLWNYPDLNKSIEDYNKRLKIYNKTGKFPVNIDKFITKEGFTIVEKLQKQFSNVKSVGFGSPVPSNVKNPKLYQEIKDKIKKSVVGRRWGAYDSGRLVREYKAAGGTYAGSKKNTPLARWYKEKWINTCKLPKIVPCGREDMNNPIAYCRPLIRVTKDTPKTATELSTQEIIRRCRRKQTNPLKIIK